MIEVPGASAANHANSALAMTLVSKRVSTQPKISSQESEILGYSNAKDAEDSLCNLRNLADVFTVDEQEFAL